MADLFSDAHASIGVTRTRDDIDVIMHAALRSWLRVRVSAL